MSTTISVSCIDQVLTITDEPPIASGGLNEDTMVFSFCSKWDEFTRTAVFYRDTEHVYHVLLDENNTVTIPHEVTDNDGVFYFGVFGTHETVTRTSSILSYRVKKGAITDATEVSDPTPSIYEQIISEMNRLGLVVTYVTNAEIDTIAQ